MKVNAPITEVVGDGWTTGWTNYFTNLAQAVGWAKSFSYRFMLDFANVLANSESAGLTVTIPSVQVGDSVQVTPYVNTVGITYKGLVTADDTVTIYALNNTTGPINPISMLYRVIVIQN